LNVTPRGRRPAQEHLRRTSTANSPRTSSPGACCLARNSDLKYSRGIRYGFTPLREASSDWRAKIWWTPKEMSASRCADIAKGPGRHQRVALAARATRLHDSISHGGMEWETQVVSAAHKLSRMPMPKDPRIPLPTSGTNATGSSTTPHLRCTSPWLLQFCRMLFSNFARYRRIILAILASAALRSTIDAEHRLVVEAALNHEADKASVLLPSTMRIARSVSSPSIGNSSQTRPMTQPPSLSLRAARLIGRKTGGSSANGKPPKLSFERFAGNGYHTSLRCV